MSFLGKVFGRKQPAQNAQPVKAFDAYGREIEISRDQWRTNVLPAHFKERWNDPEALAESVSQALRDGFPEEALEPARQLERIDPDPRRSAVLLAATFLQLKKFRDAETVLTAALRKNGPDAYALNNLAQALAGLGERERAEATLWQALQLNSNLENGVAWYVALHRERGGEPGAEDALRRLAALPGSWRPQLWLARRALEVGDIGSAMSLYHQVLARFESVPADVLMQIGGDLGNAGRVSELLELCAPRFEVKAHGLTVGNNLIKAYVTIGQLEPARALLAQLYAEQRPDWRETLVYWDGEIDKLGNAYGPVASVPAIRSLIFDAPMWARVRTPPAELLPIKGEQAVRVAFLCGSAEPPDSDKIKQITAQPTDAAGRFTRSLALYLAEETFLATGARTTVLMPWVETGGFVVSAAPWDVSGPLWAVPGVNFAVTFHLAARSEPWTVRLALVQMSDLSTLASWEQIVDPRESAEAIAAIVTGTIERLGALAHAKKQAPPEELFPPSKGSLVPYMVGLEQALAVSCALLAPGNKTFLYAERSIIENLLTLCVDEPRNVRCRFLLLSTLQQEASRAPGIAAEFRGRAERLQREMPLAQAEQSMADRMLADIFPPLDPPLSS